MPGLIEPLTGRELQVLVMLAAGTPIHGIAGELFISIDTVKKHVSHVLGKLGAVNRTEAVARARPGPAPLAPRRAPIRWHLRASGPPQKIRAGMCTFG